MTKLYEVKLSTTVVVLAEDEANAHAKANSEMTEILSDSDFDIDVVQSVTEKTLPREWDGECIPYGGDGNTRIQELYA